MFCSAINRTRNSKSAHGSCKPGAALDIGKLIFRSTDDGLNTHYFN